MKIEKVDTESVIYQLAKKDVEIENLKKEIKKLKMELSNSRLQIDSTKKWLNELH